MIGNNRCYGYLKCLKIPALHFKMFFCFIVFLLPVFFTAGPAGAVSDTFDWYSGADEYEEAMEIAREGERPIILYFHVDWCPFCTRLDKEYLDDYDVYGFMADYLRVEMDPEDGDEERAIAVKHGVKGYPTFLVTLPGIEKPWKLNPFRKNADDQSPEDFLQELKKAIAWVLRKKGYTFWDTREYEKSLSFFQRARDLYPEDCYAPYGLGVCYRHIGEKNKDVSLLKKAEENLLTALEKKPDYEEAKAQLEKLREFMRKAAE